MKHINEKLAEYKKEDHILYAVYGTPGSSAGAHAVMHVEKIA